MIRKNLDCGCTAQAVSFTGDNVYYKLSGKGCTEGHEIGEIRIRPDDISRKELKIVKNYIKSKECTIPHFSGEVHMDSSIKTSKTKHKTQKISEYIKYTPQEVKISLMKLFDFKKINGKLHFHSHSGKKIESYVGVDELRHYIRNNYCLIGGSESTEFARKISLDIDKNVKDMKF